jgi:hypothetical protein
LRNRFFGQPFRETVVGPKRKHGKAGTLSLDVRNRGGRGPVSKRVMRGIRVCSTERQEAVASLVHCLNKPRHVRVVAQGTKGTAVGGAQIAYTPAAGASGLETITYLLDSPDGFSNVATLEFNLLFVAPAPTVGNDSFAVRTGFAKLLPVLANDTAAAGTTIDVNSILESSANATPSAGQISYTAPTTTTTSFTYSVANTAGVRSGNATVTIVSFGGSESISLSRADFTVSGKTWNIRGSTNWASAALTQQRMTCWLGTALAPTASTLIGTAPIDTGGGFQLVTATAGPTPNPSGQRVSCQSTGGAIGTLASRNR